MKVLIIGLLTALLFGLISWGTVSGGVYATRCDRAIAARGAAPVPEGSARQIGWPQPFAVTNQNADATCQPVANTYWNVMFLVVDLLVAAGLAAMLYVVGDWLNDRRIARRSA